MVYSRTDRYKISREGGSEVLDEVHLDVPASLVTEVANSGLTRAMFPREFSLGPGEEVVRKIIFGKNWCEVFFLLSGDPNYEYHGSTSALQIVQGVAILTQVGTAIAESVRNYGMFKITEYEALGMLTIGEAATIKVKRVDDGQARTTIELDVSLHVDDEMLVHGHVVLVHDRVLRIMALRRKKKG